MPLAASTARCFKMSHISKSEDLLVHELCHIWQMQHRPLAAVLAWLRYRYEDNPFEEEARRAVAATRAD